MAKQAGKLFFIEVGGAPTGSPPTVPYTNLASSRSNDWTVNNTSVDVTAIDSAGMKELLEGAGVTDVQITVQAVFADSAAEETVRAAAMTAGGGAFLPLKWTGGNDDHFTGTFQISSYKRAGTYNGEETSNITFNSSGALTYTSGS